MFQETVAERQCCQVCCMCPGQLGARGLQGERGPYVRQILDFTEWHMISKLALLPDDYVVGPEFWSRNLIIWK